MSSSWEESELVFRRVRDLIRRTHDEARSAVATADSRASEVVAQGAVTDVRAERMAALRGERERLESAKAAIESGLRDCSTAMLKEARSVRRP